MRTPITMTTHLTALSPLDGRYSEKLNELRPFFSEYGLLRFRLLVETRWLETLAQQPDLHEVPTLSSSAQAQLAGIFAHFTLEDAQTIKTIEAKTNHDVKALEYFLKEKVKDHPELSKISEFIHF